MAEAQKVHFLVQIASKYVKNGPKLVNKGFHLRGGEVTPHLGDLYGPSGGSPPLQSPLLRDSPTHPKIK